MRILDLARPILWRDDETGEVILGGEDSPRADELRRELAGKLRKRLRARYDLPTTSEPESRNRQ